MIEIKLQEFSNWLEQQFDAKYCHQFEDLKRTFIGFFNLGDQVIQIYAQIRDKIQANTQYSQTEKDSVVQLLNKSIYILYRIVQQFPICLDYAFCQKFTKIFQDNINLLCSYYHSLSHTQPMLLKNLRPEKDKIIQGINRLYGLRSKILELIGQHEKILKMIAENKKIFKNKVASVTAKIQQLKEKKTIFEQYEAQVIDFYCSFQKSIDNVKSQPQEKIHFMKAYFSILRNYYAAQARLQAHLQVPLSHCRQAKNKKKKNTNISITIQQQYNQLIKWSATLLKPIFSGKNVKKFKIDEFMKILGSILKDKELYTNQLAYRSSMEQIEESLAQLLQYLRQLQKIQLHGLTNYVIEFQEQHLSSEGKQIISKYIEYQNFICKYYKLHREIKILCEIIQVIILGQFDKKVNIFIDYQF